jgi:hypothetical protein
MSNIFVARSLVFYPGYFSDNCQELSDEIILPTYHLNKLIESFDETEPLLVTLTNTTNNLTTVVSIGTPHREDKNTIFVPQWILDLIGHIGNSDDPIQIKKTDMDIPIATKIVIKPLDPIAFQIDTISCFEKTLLNLHTIRQDLTIPVCIPELGNDYIMFAYIEKVEPASISRIVNGEVTVEFINDFPENIPHDTTLLNTIIDEIMPSAPSEPIIIPEISNEEKRKRVRESWINRFQNNERRS